MSIDTPYFIDTGTIAALARDIYTYISCEHSSDEKCTDLYVICQCVWSKLVWCNATDQKSSRLLTVENSFSGHFDTNKKT